LPIGKWKIRLSAEIRTFDACQLDHYRIRCDRDIEESGCRMRKTGQVRQDTAGVYCGTCPESASQFTTQTLFVESGRPSKIDRGESCNGEVAKGVQHNEAVQLIELQPTRTRSIQSTSIRQFLILRSAPLHTVNFGCQVFG
jgi:hypothetical protein